MDFSKRLLTGMKKRITRGKTGLKSVNTKYSYLNAEVRKELDPLFNYFSNRLPELRAGVNEFYW
jgi:hypothetical protein